MVPNMVGKMLKAGKSSVVIQANADGTFSVLVVKGEAVEEVAVLKTRPAALKEATLVYETLKHQGTLRNNPRVTLQRGPRRGSSQMKDAGTTLYSDIFQMLDDPDGLGEYFTSDEAADIATIVEQAFLKACYERL